MDTKFTKSDYILLAVVFGVSSIFNIFDYFENSNNTIVDYIVDIPVYIITAIATIYCFLYWLIPKYIIQKKQYLTFIILGLGVFCFFGIVYHFATYISGGKLLSDFPIQKPRLYYVGVLLSSENVSLPFALLLAKKFYEGQVQVAKIKEQQKENELKLLRSQLDPHFLFNNLNTLDALIDSDAVKAKEYINRLSLIYRYLIQTKDAEVMELSKEMNLAENYIFLIQTRFGDDYNFHVNKNIDFSNKFLPTGAVQALLENVVKHNKVNGENKIQVIIDIDEDWLTVMNKKSNFTKTKDSFGTGLLNLKSRYQLLSKETPKIVESETEYEISIPIIKLSN
jgi:two-component system LytT family sensor kinase